MNYAAPSPRSSTSYVDMSSLTVEPSNGPSRRSVASKRTDFHDHDPDDQEHRKRFLSNSERLLAEHPREARESFLSLDAADQRQWHFTAPDVLVKQLETHAERGLPSQQAEARLAKYGSNALDEDPPTPTYIIFLLQFYNLIYGMLLFAAVASLGMGELVEGITILLIVTLNAVIATIQERNAGNALAALANMSSPQSVVVRDGQQLHIDSKMLVPGDLVVLVTGDIVPADIRLLHSVDLKVNEMLLTGESEDVAKRYNVVHSNSSAKKLTPDNMLFSSTTVTAGNGQGVVVKTGMNTRVGVIASLLQSNSTDDESSTNKSKNPVAAFVAKYKPKMTPLQRSLHKLGFIMGGIAVTVCLCVYTVGTLRNVKDPRHPETPSWLYMITVAVSLAVSAVPEGLLMVVTICLSSGTADMVKQHVLVRKMAAVETLGAASVICTDKTGTLTEGKMTAVKLWGDFCEYDITGKGFNPEGGIFLGDINQAPPGSGNIQVRATLLSCVLCSNTQLKQKEVDGVLTWQPLGNSSEAPLVVAAAKAGIWEEYVQDNYQRVVEVPFSSSRKMMITVNRVPASRMFDIMPLPAKTQYVACVKGAPNYILANCTRYCMRTGEIVPLSEQQRDQVMEAVDNLSSKALRVLAVAMQPLNELPFPPSCDDADEKFAGLSQPLVFLGLVASIDPERDGVREAIATARNASIRTVMITGDYLKTAVAIARNIDLLQVGADVDEEATDCTQLRPRGDEYLPESEIDEITSRTLVFARAKPEDKIEIVKSLQRQGLISAMTGDGVNDAPALKESDIGVAMGISGTEVAKGASDMILTDDNFCSIVSAVERGRVIYANIQKFVMFLLSTNVGEIIFIFSMVASGMFLPLEPLQILILNLFSDGMPAVALGLEKGDPTIMDNSPRPKKQPLIHGRLWFLVGCNAFLIAVGAIVTFMLGVYWNFGTFTTDSILAQGAGAIGSDFSGVTCQRWGTQGWKTYGNCAARYEDGSAVFPGLEMEAVFENATVYCQGGAYECVSDGLARSQTMTFISLTFTEVLRAYTVRSFSESVFVEMFANKYMQLAAAMSILLTITVTNTPVIMTDIFGFAYIEWFMWLVAVAGAFHAALWGELLKWVLRRRDRERQRWEAMYDGFESVLLEIRNVRHQLDRIEYQ
ncbi:TPA: hypothetical protein N0F65_006424 [Lagenidium giganteum]|uniref:Cation-transporting P-type ATPase N-terminal domain-containing protein n=1 Tax=Lagenidium giganteum TaxID=4803 RepID=A0AAV2Z4B0_9STRA|nr:TPA: hypothetical protein N0F65_006424 [Lagenidium giganteum]